MTTTPVKKAVIAVGGQGALARAIGVTTQAVHQWVKKGCVPAQRVLAVEAAVGGKVTRHELRPDLYPPEPLLHEHQESLDRSRTRQS